MQTTGSFNPKWVATFFSVLKTCSTTRDLGLGMLVHNQIVALSGSEPDSRVGNCLVDMYSRCGSLADASNVFLRLENRELASCGMLVIAHIEHGDASVAVRLFKKMIEEENVRPDRSFLIRVLNACRNRRDSQAGREIHGLLTRSGSFEPDPTLGSLLVDMYAKHGEMDTALRVFNELPNRNVVCWNVMISGYVHDNHGLAALEIFVKMQSEGVIPTNVTYSCVLKACSMVKGLEETMSIHNHIVRSETFLDTVLGNSLVDAYCKCGNLEGSYAVFHSLSTHDLTTWGALISGYVEHGKGTMALQLFQDMQTQGFTSNAIVFSCLLRACGSVGQGRILHGQINESDFQSDRIVHSSLIEMYARCRSLDEACKVFHELASKDCVTWATMISAYAQHGHGHLALGLLEEMQHQKISPNKVIFLCALKACLKTSDGVSSSYLVHNGIICHGFESELVIGNSLIDVYIKQGSVAEALVVLQKLGSRDLESWGMVIAGCVELGEALLAFDLFQNLFQENRTPNGFILYCILKACINIGVVYQGMLIHDLMFRSAIQAKEELGNALVEMYAKCGCPEEASRVLERLPDRDVASWSALAASYSAQGKCEQIDILLDRMNEDGVKVDDVVFTSLLAGCGHAGLLEKGWKYFKSMRESHGMHPKPEHYNCLIGLFSRAGNMGNAEDILKTTPSPDFVGCISLLSSCKEHRNLGLARGCYEAAIRLDPFDPSPYLLMANMQGPDCKVSRDGLDVSGHELVSSCTYPYSINDKHCSTGQDGGLC